MHAVAESVASVLEAVAAATRLVRELQDELENVPAASKLDLSPVTSADLAVQAILSRRLRETFGTVAILGEEATDILDGADARELRAGVLAAVRRVDPMARERDILAAIDRCDHEPDGSPFWAIDPIDGTRGFLGGRHCAVAVALVEDGQPVQGFLGCPRLSLDDQALRGDGVVVHAVRGQGAWVTPLAEPDAPPRRLGRSAAAAHPAPVLCQSGSDRPGAGRPLDRIAAAIGAEKERVRVDGQAKYAVIGDGRADAYVRLPRSPGEGEWVWDHAAGTVVAREAGAEVRDTLGAHLDFTQGARLAPERGVVCAAPDLLPQLLDAIASLADEE